MTNSVQSVASPVLQAPRTVQQLLECAATQGSNVQVGPDLVSAGELLDRARTVAHGLIRHAVSPGDRVALMLPNRIEVLEVLFGVGLAGVTLVPLNPFLKGEFLAHQLRDSSPVLVVTDHEGLGALVHCGVPPSTAVVVEPCVDTPSPSTKVIAYSELLGEADDGPETTPLPEVDPLAAVAILYTSGTTGRAKGCVLSHRYYVHVGETFASLFALTPDDLMFTAYPLFHASGQVAALMSTLAAGSSLVIDSEFHASTYMRDAGACGATVAWGVGAMGEAILRQPPADTDRSHSLRYCNFTPMRVESLTAFERRFGVPTSGQMYAQTECMPISMTGMGDQSRPSSAGRPSPLLTVAVVGPDDEVLSTGEVGEIVVRPKHGGQIHDGYWGNLQATAQSLRGAWHHTGDLGRFDDDGYLYFVDRQKDAIRRRGENVSSAELESAILNHPLVLDAAVVGLPASMSDEDIKVCLIVEDQSALDPVELHAWFAAELPFFAVPRYVELVEDLPRTPTGRVRKQELRATGTTGCWDFEALGLTVVRGMRRTVG
jgi:carnitine-CoA ligase